MKQVLALLGTFMSVLVTFTLVAYGFFAFVAWEPNPKDWNLLSRLLFGIIEVVIIIASIYVFVDEKDNE